MQGDPVKGSQVLNDLNLKPKSPKKPELDGYERWLARVTNPSTKTYYQNPENKEITYPFRIVRQLYRVYDLRSKQEYLTTASEIIGLDTELNEVPFPQMHWESYEQVVPNHKRERNMLTNQIEVRTSVKETYIVFTVPFNEAAVKEVLPFADPVKGARLYVREEGRGLESFTVETLDDFLNKSFKQLFYERHEHWFRDRGMQPRSTTIPNTS